MDMTAIFIVALLFVVFPAIILHHITQWKKGRSISGDDEQLLDELYRISHRLEDRIHTIERIMDVDNPDWRRIGTREEAGQLDNKIEDRNAEIRRVK
ncbi:MAG: envelope stress response membrane protein PspB [Pseudomonadota bacterium]